jgi:RNA:NAD 2'-phosphotransferase (TPT1/KptA family)
MIPGGPCLRGSEKDGQRGHVHCGTGEPDGRQDFAGFRKRGANVYMQLDVQVVLRDGVQIYESATNVLLVHEVIDT